MRYRFYSMIIMPIASDDKKRSAAMRKIFGKEKKPCPAQSGFREFDAFLRETSDPDAPPAVPAAGIVTKDELINSAPEEARARIREYYRSLTENPVREGTSLVFHTDDGTEYRFVWTGVMHYYPNKSSASGYGSDDWMYLCNMDDQYWILHLTYGPAAVWSCLPVPEADAEQIRQTEGETLRSAYYANWDQNRLILHLHPEDLRLIGKIVIPDSHRCGLLTDPDLYGA